MKDYILENSSLNEIISLFDKLLHIRITFFDIYHSEPERLEIPVKYPFCAERRRDTVFNRKCRECDIVNLEIARNRKDIHIYHCHCGMVEAIVPLYDRHNEYLGALFFGQMRDADSTGDYDGPEEFRPLFEQTPEISLEKAHETARLLKLISEYIISNELIKYRREKWVEILKENIDANLSSPPSIADMARLVHHSESFLSHNFYRYFGASPKKYTQSQRMRQADKLLRSGKKVFEVADMLGFYDEFHFSKAFKKYWRKSPSEIIAESVDMRDSQ